MSTNFISTQTSEQYLASRPKDYRNLLNDISESKDLGYARFLTPQILVIKGKSHCFRSNADAKAFILRKFW